MRQAGEGNRWAVVLAGGEGTRLRSLVQRWLGHPRPKQFCAFTGRRSMLSHTLVRARELAPASRTLTLIGPGHGRFIDAEERALAGEIIEQPRELDTGPAVFLATALVLARDPEGTVLILPSDHYVHPCQGFVDCVAGAAALADRCGKVVLLGATPSGPEREYGWIEPGEPLEIATVGVPRARHVRRFTEKPDADTAALYFRRGFLWNTLIIAVKARRLWSLGRRHVPELVAALQRLKTSLRAVGSCCRSPRRGGQTLARVYDELPSSNLSTDVLERATGDTVVVPLDGVAWSDWGRRERIVETLREIGRSPRFEEPLQDTTA